MCIEQAGNFCASKFDSRSAVLPSIHCQPLFASVPPRFLTHFSACVQHRQKRLRTTSQRSTLRAWNWLLSVAFLRGKKV